MTPPSPSPSPSPSPEPYQVAHGAVTIGAEHVHEALRELGLTEPATAPADVPADAPAVATAAASRAAATPGLEGGRCDLEGGRCDLEGGRCFTFKQFVHAVRERMRDHTGQDLPLFDPACAPASPASPASLASLAAAAARGVTPHGSPGRGQGGVKWRPPRLAPPPPYAQLVRRSRTRRSSPLASGAARVPALAAPVVRQASAPAGDVRHAARLEAAAKAAEGPAAASVASGLDDATAAASMRPVGSVSSVISLGEVEAQMPISVISVANVPAPLQMTLPRGPSAPSNPSTPWDTPSASAHPARCDEERGRSRSPKTSARARRSSYLVAGEERPHCGGGTLSNPTLITTCPQPRPRAPTPRPRP